MSDTTDSITPVGQAPATGGRIRKYETAAERAKAWRQRRAQQTSTGTPSVPPAVGVDRPELAVASLAAILPALREATAQQMAALSAIAERIESAVDLLSDPEKIDETLELARAETAREVAEARDQAASARAEASRARAAEQALRVDRDDATDAAATAWEKVAELEAAATEAAALLANTRAEHEADLAERAQQLEEIHLAHETAIAAERSAAATAADRAARAHEQFLAEQQARIDDVGRYEAQRERAATDLARVRDEHAVLVDRIRTEAHDRETATVARLTASFDARLADHDARIHDLREQLADTRADRDRLRDVLSSSTDILTTKDTTPSDTTAKPDPATPPATPAAPALVPTTASEPTTTAAPAAVTADTAPAAAHANTPPRRSPARPAPVDPDTVTTERDPDTGAHHVLAAGLPIGRVARQPSLHPTTAKWEAFDDTNHRIDRGPWKTKTQAVIGLLAYRQDMIDTAAR